MASDLTLSAMPEEILVMIFKNCFASRLLQLPGRRVMPPRDCKKPPNKTRPIKLPMFMSIILVCKAFFRIALPQFYGTAAFCYNESLFGSTKNLGQPGLIHGSPFSIIRNLYCRPEDIQRLRKIWTLDTVLFKNLQTIGFQTALDLSNKGIFTWALYEAAFLTQV